MLKHCVKCTLSPMCVVIGRAAVQDVLSDELRFISQCRNCLRVWLGRHAVLQDDQLVSVVSGNCVGLYLYINSRITFTVMIANCKKCVDKGILRAPYDR